MRNGYLVPCDSAVRRLSDDTKAHPCYHQIVFDSPANIALSHIARKTPLFDLAIRRSANSERNSLDLKNIFVGNLSFGTTENSVRSLFEQYGSVDRVNIVTDRDTGQARGFAFVEMSVDAEGSAAIDSVNGRDLDGRTLNVNEARPKTDRASGGGYRSNGGGGRQQNRW